VVLKIHFHASSVTAFANRITEKHALAGFVRPQSLAQMDLRPCLSSMQQVEQQRYLPELRSGPHLPAAFFKDAPLEGRMALAECFCVKLESVSVPNLPEFARIKLAKLCSPASFYLASGYGRDR
jgi:hypothetical protein